MWDAKKKKEKRESLLFGKQCESWVSSTLPL